MESKLANTVCPKCNEGIFKQMSVTYEEGPIAVWCPHCNNVVCDGDSLEKNQRILKILSNLREYIIKYIKQDEMGRRYCGYQTDLECKKGRQDLEELNKIISEIMLDCK